MTLSLSLVFRETLAQVKTISDLVIDDALQVLLGGGAQHRQDVVELVQVVLAGEQRPVAQHLRQDAAHRPHVNGLGVALKRTKKRMFKRSTTNLY